jgi:tRNA dimethylallyltransferase
MTYQPLLVIVGPTAVGKTALSLRLAQDFEIEIISADSRQIYRYCDIGTAKPTPQEQAVVPHHLIDVVDPDQILTVAEFQELAYAAIKAILQRQRLPVLVGGTGQWVRAVVEGWIIPRVAPDMTLRLELEAVAQSEGPQALHAQLAAVDPQSASRIDPRNVRRVIRALEVYRKTGRPFSHQHQKETPPYHVLQVGLTMSRDLLYERVDQRIDKMIELGLLTETRRLMETGYDWHKPAMLGLGYRQIGQFLRGEVRLEEAVSLIKKETRRYIRQQYNWFRLTDQRIYWFNIERGLSEKYLELKNLIETELICGAS